MQKIKEYLQIALEVTSDVLLEAGNSLVDFFEALGDLFNGD